MPHPSPGSETEDTERGLSARNKAEDGRDEILFHSNVKNQPWIWTTLPLSPSPSAEFFSRAEKMVILPS